MYTPDLFDGSRAAPTTREVAQRVRQGGLDGLPDAVRRGDGARYQEVACRSALNRVRGMPFGWTLNPYRGCTHGCHYCFARRYQAQMEMDPGDAFTSVILVKLNFALTLRRELARSATGAAGPATSDLVALGTATDPYQPIEGQYRITRQTLEVLAEHRVPTSVTTKGPLIVRDRDLLRDLGRRAHCSVAMSIPTVDEAAWRDMEPGTASPAQRLHAVRALAEAGVDVGVLMAPIVPGVSSQPRKIEQTVRAIADSGARFIGGFAMHLDGGTRDHFFDILRERYPHLVERYGRLYAGKYVGRGYQERLRAVIGAFVDRHVGPAGAWRATAAGGRAAGG